MKIALDHPYSDLWDAGYVVYNRREGRRYVVLVKDHITRSSTQYARYLLSVKLGRFLTEDEQVDHIDNDRTNDSLDNLAIVTQLENLKKASDLIVRKHGSASMYRSGCRCDACVSYKKDMNRRWYDKHKSSYNSKRRAQRAHASQTAREGTKQRNTKMKKEAKKAEVKKTVAKTISKPQTVELAGMNAVSVTLTENGKLVIKYVK